MADREEIQIPEFSVLKNGIILKNIFLNNPKWESSKQGQGQEEGEEEEEDSILLGRHPDCHIVLDHPSISRFHLEIRAKPRCQKLSVIDLASVHGTWVSGNKIQPNVPTDLVEGDTVKLGASTRVYELHWVSITCASEMEKPFLPALPEENEECQQLEDLNDLLWAQGLPSAPPLLDPFCFPLLDDSQTVAVKEFEEKSPISCSAVPVSESVDSSLPTEGENRTPEKDSNANEVQSEREYKSPLKSLSLLLRRSKSKSISSLRIHTGRSEEKIGRRSNIKEFESKCEREELLCRVLFAESVEEEDDASFVSDKQNLTPSSPKSHKQNQETSLNSSAILTKKDELFNLAQETLSHEDPIRPEQPILATSVKKRDEAYALDKPNGFDDLQKSSSKVIAALREEDDAFYSDKENWTPEVPSKMKSKKMIHIDYMQTNGRGEEEEAFISDGENLTPKVSASTKSKKLLPLGFSNVDGEEACFSGKENMTPIISGAKKSKKVLTDSQIRTEVLIMERRKERIPFHPLLENSPSKIGSSLKPEHNTVNKERIPFKSLLEKSPSKNRSPLNDARKIIAGKERVPFQSLLENSPSRNEQRTIGKEGVHFQPLQSSPLRNSSPVSNAQKTEDTGNEYSSFIPPPQIIGLQSNPAIPSVDQVSHKVKGNKKWNMIADTGCFLDEESRKSLQLLEGLKGTQLIIPNIVIRELDCLKRRESLFRKETKAASSVLLWIEECMVKSSWWIHVQSSLEMMPIAVTPPTSPRTQFGDGSLMEIVSPTAEDHILSCALMFKRLKDEEQLVLLTDSITLRIKAMAEGLLCESPTEFRESLVNPYSKRFLWSASSPRGSTWSCLEEAGLIENCYYRFPPITKTAEATESIRGLKLILLHNSHYGQTSSVS